MGVLISPDQPQTDLAFPFHRRFNLLPLIDYWKKAVEDESEILARHAKGIVEELEKRPELLADEITKETLDKHLDLVPYLMTPVIPLGGSSQVYAAVIVPFEMSVVYQTDAFRELGMDENYGSNIKIAGIELSPEMLQAGKIVNAYAEVLMQLKGIGADWENPFIYSTDPDENGLRRHFRFEFVSDFMRVDLEGEIPEISQENLDRIQDEPFDLALWSEILPADQIGFSGFGVMNAAEITVAEELSLLKDDLLQPNSMSSGADIDHLELRLRTILRRPDIKLGLIALEMTESGAVTGARPIGRSLLMHDSAMPDCPDKNESFYMKAFHSGEPIIVDDLQGCEAACTGFEYKLIESGFRNVVIAPLHVDDKLVGLLELASPHKRDVNNWNIHNLLEVRGLFATAIHREIESREDKLQAVIKRRYTAIHPAVEWRFREAAQRYLDDEAREGRAELESVVFNDVHPLFGLSDIRGSSTHRVSAIQEDLLAQLELARAIVTAVTGVKQLPALDELGYQLEKHAREIAVGLSSGDEVSVLDFLRAEVESRLDHLSTYGDQAREAVEAYKSAIDPALGILYRRRREFDQSVHMINDRIADHLEQEQEKAQSMFPHYFERYLTDGVDYNAYIGASLMPDNSFDPIYLRNLRLWQLMMTCGIVWEMKDLWEELPTKLETAHLILAQSSPLAVRFRDDEKKFDVDGAYNARYEIIKKRIDKATIKGSGERLTQPGMIAIVYAQQREEREYRRYLDYLVAAGYLTGEIEHHVLEDLQGVSGLKALRVQVAATSPDVEYEVTPAGQVEPVKVA